MARDRRPLTALRFAQPPISTEDIAAIRAPFRKATLLPAHADDDEHVFGRVAEHFFFRDWIAVGRAEDVPDAGSFLLRDVFGENVLIVRIRDGLIRAKHPEDLEGFSFVASGLTPIRCETWGGFVFLRFADEATTPPLRTFMGDWFEHHEGFGRDLSTLRRAARLTNDVHANWKIVAQNCSECYDCPPVHSLLNKLTPYDLGEDFLADGPWKGGWMVFADGCETMSMDGLRHGRPLLCARDEVEASRIYYDILWPNLILSVHPDYVRTHEAWPDGPNRSIVHCDLYVEADALDTVDVAGAVDFWDMTNKEDYHVVDLQQRGTRSRSRHAGRYSNQEASVHAFHIMVADRYAMDGVRTVRGWRRETASDRRLVTRKLGGGSAE